jgi:hypothetical protein
MSTQGGDKLRFNDSIRFAVSYGKELGKVVIVLLCLGFTFPVLAQNKINVFPQVADGVFSDGTYYTTTFMIMPWFETTPAITCTLRLQGLSVNLNDQRRSLWTITIPANGGYFAGATRADQGLQTGYAVLTCIESVYAQALYSFYAANGAKLGEATVFGVDGDIGGFFSYRLIADQRGGSQLGIAIANDTDLPRTYRLTLNGVTRTVVIPARSSIAQFLTDIMPTSRNTVGVLKIDTTDFTDGFFPMGLRYTGGTFTTIPAN